MSALFTPATFTFLNDLAIHNDKLWFEANKARYEELVRGPALAYIEAMAEVLPGFAPNFRADARKMGGSLMRVYRDTRFSRDKTPYKTNIGIHFRHNLGKGVHARGFYVHIALDQCFLGVGCWHPEAEVLGRIRQSIAEKPERWFAVRDDASFTAHWTLDGESLARPPRGFAADHPAITDLKRKDFVAMAALGPDEVVGKELVALTAERFAAAAPFMAYLCGAVGVQY